MKKYILIIVAGLAVVTTTSYFFLKDVFFTPERSLIVAANNISELDSFAVDNNLQIDIISLRRGDGARVNVDLAAKVNYPQEEMMIQGTISGGESDGIAMGGEYIEFEGAVTYTQGDLYLDFTSFDVPDLNEKERRFADALKKKTLLLEDRFIEELEKFFIKEMIFGRNFNMDGIKNLILNPMSSNYKDGGVFISEIFKKAVEDDVIVIEKKGTEEVRGKISEKYLLTINEENVWNFLLEVVDDYYDELYAKMRRQKELQMLFYFLPSRIEIKEEIINIKESWNEETREEYVGGSVNVWLHDSYILKAEIDLQIEDRWDRFLFLWEIYFYDLDKATISAPEDYRSFDEMMNEWEEERDVRDKERRGAVEELYNYAQKYRNEKGSYENFSETEEVEEITKRDIFSGVSFSLEAGNIKDNTDKYFCVEVRLENDNYFCIDYRGEFFEKTRSTCGGFDMKRFEEKEHFYNCNYSYSGIPMPPYIEF